MTSKPRWVPKTDAERLDRLESMAEIRQLPLRYALAVDTRNLDDLVELFLPDVRLGKGLAGRPALRAWFAQALSEARTTIHFVGNHTLEFETADLANGVVYCRDELERPTDWGVGYIQYWDRYVRRDGIWCFEKRGFNRWYMVDALARPSYGAGFAEAGAVVPGAKVLPEAWESWGRYWLHDAPETSPWRNGIVNNGESVG
jgi:hypothetical protein